MVKSIAPRREIKFLMDEAKLSAFEVFLRGSPLRFSERYEPRVINTIYFDDPAMSSLAAHLRKELCRSKLRLRWYGTDSSLKNGQLELKEKRWGAGHKHYWPVTAELGNSWRDLRKQILATLPISPQSLLLARPVAPLFIRYRRRYFLSGDGLMRVTLDRAIFASDERFGVGPDANHLRAVRTAACIVELKFDLENSRRVEPFLRTLPQAAKGCSKYLLCASDTGVIHSVGYGPMG